MVYRIELDQSQPVSATLLEADADLDLFLLRYAYPDSCIAAGDNSLQQCKQKQAFISWSWMVIRGRREILPCA